MPFSMNDEQDIHFEDRLVWKSNGKIVIALASWTMGLLKFYESPKLLIQSCMLEFVVIYVISMLIIGIPMAFLELTLSQYSSKSLIKSWGFCPLFKGIGYARVVMLFIFQAYFNVWNGYALFYLVSIYKKSIEWNNCSEVYIREKCYNFTNNINEAMGKNETNWQGSAQQFWLYKVLNTDKNVQTLGWPNWEVAGYFLAHLFLLFTLTLKGPKILNKVVPILLALALTKLVVLLFITSYTVGSFLGMSHLFKLEFKLSNMLPWIKNSLSAQIFNNILFSLGLGTGVLPFLGSKFSFRQPTHAHAISLNVLNICFIVINTIVLYNIYGILSYHSEIPIEELVLYQSKNYFYQPLFALIPNSLQFLPGYEKIWIFIFYSCIYITGLGSSLMMSMTILEEFRSYTSQNKNLMSSVLYIFATCFCGTILHTNLGAITREYLNDIIRTILIPILLSLECIILIFGYGLLNFLEDVQFMFGHRLFTYWQICLFIAPFLLSTMTIFPIIDFYSSDKYQFYMQNDFMNVLQKCVLCCVLFWIPFMGMVHIIKKGNWRIVMQPAESWGPQNNILRKSRLAFEDNDSSKEYVYQKNLLAMKLNINDSDENYY